MRRALEQIDAIRREVSRRPADLILARSAADIFQAHSEGRIAVLIAIEGGHMIDSSLDVLRRFFSLGASYMTLTHVRNTEWADASTARPQHNGLTSFGREVIAEMNRLGMIVDVSHVSDKTLLDVLDVSRAPVFASHSSCHALCDTPRNLSDDMIRALAAHNGLVQINFNCSFISRAFARAEAAHPEIEREIDAEVEVRCGKNEARKLVECDRIVREFAAKGKLPRVERSEIVDHIDHLVRVAGIGRAGLGSDFDGACMPFGIEDAAQLPRITEALLRKGYAEADVQKILGGNFLRLMHDVETASHRRKGST